MRFERSGSCVSVSRGGAAERVGGTKSGSSSCTGKELIIHILPVLRRLSCFSVGNFSLGAGNFVLLGMSLSVGNSSVRWEFLLNPSANLTRISSDTGSNLTPVPLEIRVTLASVRNIPNGKNNYRV